MLGSVLNMPLERTRVDREAEKSEQYYTYHELLMNG